MISEHYTFACPACAVRLSVPKALAGVRGPCPQCHQEITAPEPEAEEAPVLVGAGVSEEAEAHAAPPPARRGAPPLPWDEEPADQTPASEPEPPASGSLPLRPPPVPESPEALPSVLPVPPPLPEGTATAATEDDTAAAVASDHFEPSTPAEQPAPTPVRAAGRPRRRRSRVGAVVGAVGFALVGIAAASLHFLPPQSLRQWLAPVLPKSAIDQLVGAEAVVSEFPAAGVLADQAGPVAETQPPPPAAETAPPVIDIRPALTPPSQDPSEASESAAPTLAEPVPEPIPGPESAPIDPAAAGTAAPEAAATPPAPGAEATAAPAAAPAASAPPVGAASLLPDISGAPSSETPAINEAQAGAQEALTLFLQARTWKDRMALSDGGAGLQSEMEAHYRKVKDGPNPPTSVEHVASAPLPDGLRTVQVFHVTFPDLPQGFPVPVLQTEEGWKIDWQAFTEFREGRLKKFLAQYQDAPAVFRVRLQRAHYQDRAVPDLDKKYIFRIAAPIDGHEGYVFVDKEDSIVGPKIADKLEWDAIHHVMAKLKWVRGGNGRAYVELRDIVSDSWRPAP